MSEQTNNAEDVFSPLGESFRLRLKMQSDWHIGSGAGRPGDVDRLVRRDADNLPYVPAKTLTGIWRDGCERAALGLDNGEPGAWSRWVPFLFGEQAGHMQEELHLKAPDDLELPRPAALSVRSAHFPKDLRQALRKKDAVREAVTFVKPGVSISERSGRARANYLRFEELARAGAELEAQGQIDWHECDEAQKRAATSLLLAGAKLVERIGGKRRRGVGRCALTVNDDAGFEVTLDWIAKQNQPPEPPPPDREIPQALLGAQSVGDWRRYCLVITTRTPLIIARHAVGNLIKTTDYIPGTHLLAVITRSLRKVATEVGVNLNGAIINGGLMVTNATIEVDGAPGRPVPFCLFQEKLSEGLKGGEKVYNRFCDDTDDKPQLKGYRSGYIGWTAERAMPNYRTVPREVETHNVVKDASQRPDEAVGGVFSYEAIKACTKLRAEMWLKSSLVEKLETARSPWLDALNGEHRLGRSKKDDYGLIKLAVERLDSALAANIDKTAHLTVWLLSDMLLRDERLRPAASLEQLRKALERELAVTLTLREDGAQKLLPHLSRQNRTDSWHVGWGLPRPSLVGLAAGTCAVFSVSGKLDEIKLAELEREGLGERRAEGFGRVRFNDPLLRSKLDGAARSDMESGNNQPNEAEPGDEAGSISQSESDYLRLIEREAARREIHRLALGFAIDQDNRRMALGIEIKNKESRPTLSQLGALRSVISRLQSRSDQQQVTGWIEQLEATDNRLKNWPGENGKEKGSLDKIRDLVTDPERVWALLGKTTPQESIDWSALAITKTGESELKDELWAEAVRALVDACVRAHKRETERQMEGKDGAKN